MGSEEEFSLSSKFKDLIDVSRINLRWHFTTLGNNHFSQIRYLSRNRFSLFIRGPNFSVLSNNGSHDTVSLMQLEIDGVERITDLKVYDTN